MNDLRAFFDRHNDRLLHKWHHYFDIYDRHFARFRGQEICLVEFGVSQGGSPQMWRDYFEPKATIYGVDINPNCKQFEEPGGSCCDWGSGGSSILEIIRSVVAAG